MGLLAQQSQWAHTKYVQKLDDKDLRKKKDHDIGAMNCKSSISSFESIECVW